MPVNKKLLVTLLTKNELNHRQIGERVGCSAERVRQLEQSLLCRTGHEAKVERRDRKLREESGQISFVVIARRKGLSVEQSKKNSLSWHKRKFYVNGKCCLLRKAYLNVGYKGWYTMIRKPRQPAEICVMELGTKNFLIIPMTEMPRSATMFRLAASSSPRKRYNVPPRWRKYLDNWSAF
jgi:hypothetical protein